MEIPAIDSYTDYRGFNFSPTSASASEAMNSTSSNLSERVIYDTSVQRSLGIAIGIFDIFVGSIGNLLTLIAVVNNKKLHKPFYIFIANLCVIDFLTATAMMPFNVASYASKTWPFGVESFSCSFMAFSYYCCGYTSIVCLLVITVNRFVGVVFPEHYDRLFTRKRVMIVIFISWIFAPTFLSPFFFFNEVGFAWSEKYTLCVFNTKDPIARNYMQFIRVLFQMMPLVIIITLYSKIFLTSKQVGQAVSRISKKSRNGKVPEDRERTYRRPMNRGNLHAPLVFTKVLKSFKSNSSSLEGNSTREINDNFGTMENKECYLDQCNGTVPVIDLTAVDDTEQPLVTDEEDVTIKLNLNQTTCNSLLNTSERLGGTEDSINSHLSTPITKNRSNPDLQLHYERYCSAPTTPRLGVKKAITSRSLGGGDSFHYSNNSSQQLDKSSAANLKSGKRSPSPCNGSPIMKRPSYLRRSNGKYSSAIELEAKKRKMVDRRLLRISVTICTAFMVLFLPSLIISLIPGKKHPGVHMFASVITWFNSCVNPIIYCFMNAKMREQYRLLLRKALRATCRCLHIEKYDRPMKQPSLMSSSRNSRRELE